MFNTCIPILITILLVFLIITILLIMLIKYNRAWLIDLNKLAKPGNLSGFPFSTIRRIRELKIQKRIQQQKRTNQNNHNKQHDIGVRNLRQIQTHNPKNEQLKHERIATVNIRSIKHKEDLLWNAINDLKIDITIVTETWLQDTNEDTIWVEEVNSTKTDFKYTHVINKTRKVEE